MHGLGFIHPGFLAAGLAVALPIVIHLLFRQKARRVDIGSVYFLRVVLRDQAHRRNIGRWLLLALRVAGVLLLASLFARPYWKAPESPAAGKATIVLIDRSASMGAGPEGKTPWDLARQRVLKLIDQLPQGSPLHLAYFDANGVAPTTPREMRESVRQLRGHRLCPCNRLGARPRRRGGTAAVRRLPVRRPASRRHPAQAR